MGAKEIIVGSITWILLLLVLGLPLLVLSLYRGTLILIAKCFRRDLFVFDGIDVMQCAGDSHEKSIVNFGFILKVSSLIKVEELRELWKEKFLGDDLTGLPGFENLTRCVEIFGGYAFGKRVKVSSLENLIREKFLGEGKCLEDFVAEWLLTKYTKDSPSWEVIVMPLKDSRETAVAFKIHHAFADGYSVLHMLDKLSGNQSPYLVKDFQENWIQQGLKLIQAPSHTDKLKGDSQLNIVNCKREESLRMILSFVTLDLKIMKQIRQFYKVHMASVVMSLLSGALRKYSIEKGIVTEDKVPHSFPMATPVAWPRHPTKVYKSFPKLCNHWVTILLKASTKDDPVERLLEIEESYNASMESGLTHFGFHFVQPAMALLPTGVLTKAFGGDMGIIGGYSVTIGGDNYKLLGSDVTRINSIIAMQDIVPTLPISIFSFSHSDKMELTIHANPQRFPDRDAIERISKVYLPEEVERLRLSVTNS